MPVLHITNGDCAADTLRTLLTDRVLVTCDVLHDGPAPRVDGDAWYDVRARFLAEDFEARYDETRASLAAFDRAVVENGRHDDEIVLWFEHDLFDQLLLIRTLDLMVRLKPDTTEQVTKPDSTETVPRPDTTGQVPVVSGFSWTNVSLICIGEFPGVERFIGLGQLNAEQLASLQPARTPVAAAQFALASEAWQAYRADDPRELFAVMVRLRATPANGLPFLHDAIHRLFEEYPSTTNGLSRTADAILRAVATESSEAGALFRATQAAEPRPFMGDSGFFQVIERLASARVPLVTIAPPSLRYTDGGDVLDLRAHAVAITEAGCDVLAGRADAVALNGIDEWRGGVRLGGRDRSPWRWDPARETLVSWVS